MNTQTVKSNPSIKKGDMVQVIAGRDKGKTGKVLSVFPDAQRVTLEKMNIVKRNTKPTQKSPQGGIVEKEASLSYSNVLLLCPKCNKGVRTGRKLSGTKKLRICKKCGETI